MMQYRSLIIGTFLCLIVLNAVALSLVWIPYDIKQLSIPDKLQTPNWDHWLGTDHFGRDILSMTMVGARTSLAVALLAVGIGMGIGVPLGLAAAARRGAFFDEIIMRTNDLIFAFPSLVIAILITALFGAGAMNAIIAIGIFNIPVFARVSRGAALSLWQKEFILAARGQREIKIAYLSRAYSAQPDKLIDRAGNDPIFSGYSCRSRPKLCRPWRPTTHTKLGPYACRCTDNGKLCPTFGFDPRQRNNLDSARAQPFGRRPARFPGPQTQEVAVMSLLCVDQLNIKLGPVSVLTDVSFSLQQGEILALTGESGSGKSMTALALMQLLPDIAKTDGRILFQKEDLTTKTEKELCKIRGADISMVFQEPMTALNPVKTIGAQVSETLILHKGKTPRAARESAQRILDKVGLSPSVVPMERFPHELSGGQRQRVVIAIAVALTPSLLIADEPTTALDVTTQAKILNLLKCLVKETNMAMILITHDLAVVTNMADNIAVMQKGQIVEMARTKTFFFTNASSLHKVAHCRVWAYR